MDKFTAALIGVAVGYLVGCFEYYDFGLARAEREAVAKCEEKLPRHQHCVAVITAKVAQPPSGE